jgi:hypothetical protein
MATITPESTARRIKAIRESTKAKTAKMNADAEKILKRQGKPLNYAIMSREDYIYRRSVRDKYLVDNVLSLQISEKYDPEKIL